MDVRMPDGTIIRNVPEGTTKAQLTAKLDALRVPSNKTNMLEAAALGAGQGASMGFGEEIGNALGTLVSKPVLEARELITGDEAPSWGELYGRGVEKSREAMKTAREEHPIAYTGGELGGAIGTGIYGATTKGGAALASRLGSGGLGARVLKGAGAGAASGGFYGFGSGEGSGAERLSNAGQGAILGGATGGVLPVAGGALRATGQAIVPKIDEAVKPLAKRAMDLGIPLRLDQISPTRARKTLQKVSQELPFSGAGDFEAKQLTAFNRGVAKTIGIDADNLSPESIQTFLDNAGNKFGVLTKGKQIKIHPKTFGLIDKTVRSASGNVRDDVVTLIQKNADAIKSELSAGTLNGSKLASIRSDIVKRLPSIDPQARAYVAEFVDAIDESVLPALSKDERLILQQARKEWRNFKTIEPLLEKSTDGMINPAELLNRVQSSKYIKASRLKTGDDDLVDLARIGKKFLPKAGGSDTFQKAALGAGGTGIVGTALVNPALGAALATKAAVGLGANRAFQGGYNTSQRLIGKALQEGAEPSFTKGTGALIGTTGAFPNVIDDTGAPTRMTISPDMQRNPAYDTPVAPDLPAVNLPPQSALPQSIKQDEGLRYSSYMDTTGNKTVGRGFNMDSGIARKVWNKAGLQSDFDAVYRGEQAIAPQEAEALANASFQIAYDDAVAVFPDIHDYTPARQEAIMNLSYQLGGNRLGKFDATINAAKQGNWTTAARHLLKSQYAMQTPDRARRIARAFING